MSVTLVRRVRPRRALPRRLLLCSCLAVLALAASACSAVTVAGPIRSGAIRPGASTPLPEPLSSLLADSSDLGPSTVSRIASVLALRSARRPVSLERWARRHGLRTAWQLGDDWASLSGSAAAMGAALGVSVHDYRSRSGADFYAALRQPGVPVAVRGEVTQMGRLLDFSPHSQAAPSASGSVGLSPRQLVAAYDATGLQHVSGNTTGTVVLFEWGAYKQSDLDAFASTTGLPAFHPQLFGGTPKLTSAEDETELDAEVVHAIAPHARVVVADADPTFDGSTRASVGLAVGRLFTRVDRQFPGAVWSLSIGWGCDRLYTGADMLPAESALRTAEAHGTSAFDASGDTAGLECKDNTDYSTPPSASDVGVNAVGSLPAMTSVGGTRLTTDAHGHWIAEQAWDYSSLSQGGSGGVSRLWDRPSWQTARGIDALRGAGHRLLPDVSADADPQTGVAVVIDGTPQAGGGTSQAAPIWAGFTVLMDDYLQHHGGHLIGALNPVAYQVARDARLPAFHDITLGGDAVDFSKPGYDLVTGLGSPMVDNLVQDILALQRGGS